MELLTVMSGMAFLFGAAVETDKQAINTAVEHEFLEIGFEAVEMLVHLAGVTLSQRRRFAQ